MAWTDKRPMSPHLSVWKWHPAMLSSILHRACGIALYVTLIAFSLLLLDLACGGSVFTKLSGLLYSPLGGIKLFGISFAAIYLAISQFRHLIWDAGKGFEPGLANKVSIGLICLAIIGAACVTFCGTGAL